MKAPPRVFSTIALFFIALLAMTVLSGCAMGVAGARVSLATPFSKPNFSYDSVGVAQKNDRAAGATFTNADGTAAKADADTLTGSADQIVQVGGDASNARSTDSSLADDQSQAQGRQGGDQTDSGSKTLDQRRTPTVNVGPAGGAQLGVGTAGPAEPVSLDANDIRRLRAILEAADRTISPGAPGGTGDAGAQPATE